MVSSGEVAITSVSPVRTSWYWLVPFASLVTRSFVTSTSDRALIVSGVDVTERNRPNRELLAKSEQCPGLGDAVDHVGVVRAHRRGLRVAEHLRLVGGEAAAVNDPAVTSSTANATSTASLLLRLTVIAPFGAPGRGAYRVGGAYLAAAAAPVRLRDDADVGLG